MSEAHLSPVPESPMPHINEGGFYQTPNVMTMKAIRAKLTGADWALWAYFQMFDPHGDRMVQLPNVQEIAEALDISTRQIKRSLKKLEELGLYDWEPVAIKGQNLAGKLAKQVCQEKKQLKSSGKNKMTNLSSPGRNCPTPDNFVQPSTNLSSPGRDCPTETPKAPAGKGFGNAQTNQTYSDFLQTLSDSSERENFKNYCERRASQEAKNPRAWIRKAWRDLWNDFQEEEAKRKEADEQIQASKEQPTEKAPPTAAKLHFQWRAGGRSRKIAIEKALELGYVVTPEGIFDPSEDPSEGKFSGGGGGGE